MSPLHFDLSHGMPDDAYIFPVTRRLNGKHVNYARARDERKKKLQAKTSVLLTFEG